MKTLEETIKHFEYEIKILKAGKSFVKGRKERQYHKCKVMAFEYVVFHMKKIAGIEP